METTPRAAKVLSNAILMHGWEQTDLAKASGVNRAQVSMHLNGSRPIRDDHLAAYSAALDRSEQAMLLSAWIQDTLPPAVLENVLESKTGLIREEVASYAVGLSYELQQMLCFWAERLAVENDLASIFKAITRKSGYSGPSSPIEAKYKTSKSHVAPGHAKAASPHQEP